METNALHTIQANHTYSYAEYTNLMEEYAKTGKTSGQEQSEASINYTKLNWQRMKRLSKTISLIPEMERKIAHLNQSSEAKLNWLILSETWCGDAAQNLPILQKIAEKLNGVELKLIFRDENLSLMDQHLTNGGRSIPKLIVMNKINKVIGEWGPRPIAAQKMSEEARKKDDFNYQEFNIQLQDWYNHDAGRSLQYEFIDLLDKWF